MMERKIPGVGNCTCFVAGSVGEGLNLLSCLFTKKEFDIDVMGSLLETVAMERQRDGNVNVLKLESSKLGYALLRILGSRTSTNDNRYLSSQKIRNRDKRCILRYYFVANLFCPNYFIRDCNVLRQKLNDLEKQNFIDTLENFITKDNFKEKILSLLKT